MNIDLTSDDLMRIDAAVPRDLPAGTRYWAGLMGVVFL
jgi:hypothetical protein